MDSSLDILERVAARVAGPMHMRLILQPLMAIALGILDGVKDAHKEEPPFLSHLFTRAHACRLKLGLALKRLMIPILLAIVLDAISQFLIFHQVRILGAVVFGTALMGLPYSVARELANRFVSARAHHRWMPSRG